jgi:hypothetical protein
VNAELEAEAVIAVRKKKEDDEKERKRQEAEEKIRNTERNVADQQALDDEAERLHAELVVACDGLSLVKTQLTEIQDEALRLKEEKRSVISIYRKEAEKKREVADLDFSESNGFDVARRSTVKDDCKNVSVNSIKDKLFSKKSGSDVISSPKEGELKALAEAKRVQVFFNAIILSWS